jgi:UDP-glucose 4-epimerase
MVIPTFVNQALKGRDLTVYGDGQQTRSFCHVQDVASALAGLMECPEAIGKVVNIGNNEEVSINRLARRVKDLTRSSSLIVHVPYEKAYAEGFEDMLRRVPDITLAKNLIGFHPKYGLDDIILDVVKYVCVSLEKEEMMGARTGHFEEEPLPGDIQNHNGSPPRKVSRSGFPGKEIL